VEEDGGGRYEEDSDPSLVMASGAPLESYPDQKVLQEEATTLGECPHGWTRAKLEPDCHLPNSHYEDITLLSL
jgi:hypothetical protein